MGAVVTTLPGGLLAIAAGLAGIGLSERRERSRWLRDTQLQATTNLLSALQLLVRRMINLSYLSPADSVDQASPIVASYHEATVEWNRALYAALLVAAPDVAAAIPELDREVDRLLDLAVARAWTRAEFRRARARLGQMAAAHLRLARTVAGLPAIELRSIWTRDDIPGPAPGTESAADVQPETALSKAAAPEAIPQEALRGMVPPGAVPPEAVLPGTVPPEALLPDGSGAANP